jgi:hypothetical protein
VKDFGKVPWSNKGPPKPRPDGTLERDASVDNWFARCEDRLYMNKSNPKAPIWGIYAPWHGGVANTMFWM